MKGMKTIFSVLPLMALGECTQHFGTTTCGPGQIQMLDVAGMVYIHDTTVIGETKINGTAHARNSQLNALELNGLGQFNQVLVKGAAKVVGYLEATQSQFNQLTVVAEQLLLDQTEVGPIRIQSHAGQGPVIWLKNGSHVKGNICFEGDKGTVKLNGGASISGQVINGQIIETSK
ncbi:MAG: hypothetical protein CMF42_03160 [Legionellales bacterium]|nr:hypothetical protein [Legionellales bacterium]OUX67769.1 MAG: hypothetical protein CBD38_02025 [bacterium TMED178]|tara:strand:+ start:3619 stop:4143 length:525 start_codon:yes stop_codon:yes gene_type:complete